MKVSYNWLQDYFAEPLPPAEELARMLTMHSFEVENVEKANGDYVLDSDVLPNRAHDALSHDGVVREVAALLNATPNIPERSLSPDDSLKTSDHASLKVEDEKLVPRALKRIVFDVAVKPSPDWLRERLTVLGHNTINNVVDATNYIMLETGQPVHAFDFDKLSGEKKDITIRKAKDGERITTLDGEEYTLGGDMLVIADSEKALDIAGIKGGADSGIGEGTRRVVLSVCNFNPSSIRNTSQKLNLVTDASKRFGYGLAPELAEYAMERLAALISEVADGRVAEDTLDVYPRPRGKYNTGVSAREVNNLLGTDINDTDVENALKHLGFEAKKVNPVEKMTELAKELEGTKYVYGASITYDAPEAFDCSSFTAYLFANAGISIPRMTVDQFVFGEEIEKNELKPGDLVFSLTNGDITRVHEASKEFMPGTPIAGGVNHVGLYTGGGMVIHASSANGEVVEENLDASPSFKDIRGFKRIPAAGEERFAVVVPPYRLDIGAEEDLIEEVGRMYGYEKISTTEPHAATREPEVSKVFYYVNKIRDILVGKGFSELYTYSFVSEGNVEIENPIASDKKFLRPGLSSSFQSAFSSSKVNQPLGEKTKVFEIGTIFPKDKNSEKLSLAFGISGKNVDKDIIDTWKGLSDEIGVELLSPHYGGVSEKIISLDDMPNPPESYGDLIATVSKDIKYKTISPYPFVLRDVAVWTPTGTEASDVETVITENAGELLSGVKLFDEFEKDGRISYAFRLAFQSDSRTLSDGEVNEIMERVTALLNKQNGWKVR